MKKMITRIFTLLLTIALIVPLAALTVSASEQTEATLSNQEIWINGRKTEIRGYAISGMHFFMLRDISRAFNIHYDFNSTSGTITIDTMQAYSGPAANATTLAQTAASTRANHKFSLNGVSRVGGGAVPEIDREIGTRMVEGENYVQINSAAAFLEVGMTLTSLTRVDLDTTVGFNGPKERGIQFPRIRMAEGYEVPEMPSEEAVHKMIIELQKLYPNGSRAADSAKFANQISVAVFGSYHVRPERKHSDFDELMVGDIARINNDTHSVVILDISDKFVTVVEGNSTLISLTGRVRWGYAYPIDEFKEAFNHALTRYPA